MRIAVLYRMSSGSRVYNHYLSGNKKKNFFVRTEKILYSKFQMFHTVFHFLTFFCCEIGIKSWLFQRSVLFLVFFAFFVNNFVIHFLMSKNDPERMSESSQTYLFNSNYNIDPSTMVIRHFKNMTSIVYFCNKDFHRIHLPFRPSNVPLYFSFTSSMHWHAKG